MTASYGLFAVLNDQRQILSLNQSLLDEMGVKNAQCVLGLRVGDYLDCRNASQAPNGCGTAPNCAKCGAVLAQLAALESDLPQEAACLLTALRGNATVQLSFQVKCCPITISCERFLLMFFQDLAPTKQLAHQELNAIIETSSDGFLICDARGRILDVNQAYCAMSGYSSAELQTMTIADLHLPQSALGAMTRLEQVMQGGLTRFESQHRARDGRLLDIEASATYSPTRGGRIYSFIRDITERKGAERALAEYQAEYQAQLSSLASELSLAQERERRTIAYEIHDHVVQNMSLGKIMLSNCIHTGSFDKLQQVCGILDESIRQMRSLIFDLSPPMLYDMGLIPALETLGERLGQEHGFGFNVLDNYPTPRLEEAVLIGLYQVLRELLLNVVKHAQASNVTLSAEAERQVLRISLEDDGVGFDAESVARKAYRQHSIGLFGVQQRLKHLGGSCEVESSQGRGTRVEILVPLYQPEHGEEDGDS
jgi:PAS domain S-box-containing protein